MPDPVVKQVEQEITPLVAFKLIGPVAATAMVPLLSGTVKLLVLPEPTVPRSNFAFFVLSALLIKVVELSTKDLLVKVCVWLRKANVSFALSAGMVATLDEVGATVVIVVVLVVPKTNWLVVGVRLSAPLRVKPPKVGVAVLLILCGSDNVIAPVPPEAMTWLAVPVMEVTPVLAMLIVPAPFVTEIPVPVERLARAKPLPLPMRSLPLAAAEVSRPVPPLAAESCAWVERTPEASLTTTPVVLKAERVTVPEAEIAPMLPRSPTVPASLTEKRVLVPSEIANVLLLPWVMVKPPATVAPPAAYVPPVNEPPETVPPENVPPESEPPEMVAPLMVPRPESVGEPDPTILPVKV